MVKQQNKSTKQVKPYNIEGNKELLHIQYTSVVYNMHILKKKDIHFINF